MSNENNHQLPDQLDDTGDGPLPQPDDLQHFTPKERDEIVEVFQGEAALAQWQKDSLRDEIRRRLNARARAGVEDHISAVFPQISHAKEPTAE